VGSRNPCEVRGRLASFLAAQPRSGATAGDSPERSGRMDLSSRARGRLHVHADFDRQTLSYGCTLSRNGSGRPWKVVLPFTCVPLPAGVPASAPGSLTVPAGTPRNDPLGLLVVLVAFANVYGGAEASPATYTLPSDATAS